MSLPRNLLGPAHLHLLPNELAPRETHALRQVSIMISEANEFAREGLVSIFRHSHPEWIVIGHAGNSREAVELGDRLRPDVAVIDLSNPDPDCLKTTRHLSSVSGSRVLVLVEHLAVPVMQRLRRAGARALVSKREPASRIIEALESVLSGKSFFPSEVRAQSSSRFGPDEFVPVQFLLTRRELDILRLLAAGHINKQIAHHMNVGLRTVETHHGNIRRRLAADSLAALVRIAVRDGLIRPADTTPIRTAATKPLNVAA